MTQILNFLPNLVTLPALKSHIRFDQATLVSETNFVTFVS